jgi:hypothetical protein
LQYGLSVVNIVMSDSYLDRPQDDGTPKAHPAYKRGQIAGTVTVLGIIKAVAEGSDIGDGQVGSPQIEAARRIIIEMQTALLDTASQSTAPSKKAQKALDNVAELVKQINI